MRYKADYRPSDLLCPVRYIWTPYEDAKPVLDASQDSQLCVLSDTILPKAAVGQDGPTQQDSPPTPDNAPDTASDVKASNAPKASIDTALLERVGGVCA